MSFQNRLYNLRERSSKNKFIKTLLRYQSYFIFIIFILLIVMVYLSTLAAQTVFDSLLKFKKLGQYNGVQFQNPELPEQNLNVHTPQQKSQNNKVSKLNDIDWQDREFLREAAVILSNAGDFDSAIKILMQGAEDKASIRSVGLSVFANLKSHFPEQLEMEKQAYKKALKKEFNLNDMEDQHLFLFLNNLHARLAGQTKSPDQLINIFLEAKFQSDKASLKIYIKSKINKIRPYTDSSYYHEQFYQTYIRKKLITSLKSKQEDILLFSNANEKWYAELFSKRNVNLIKHSKKKELAESIKMIWQDIPAPLKKFWSEELLFSIQREDNLKLDESFIKENTYLAPAKTTIDSEFLLKAVRTHPFWRKALQGFNYEAAIQQLPAILKQLHCAKFFIKDNTVSWDDLIKPLESEKKIAIKSFQWKYLRKMHGIKVFMPEYIQRMKYRTVKATFSSISWEDIDSQNTYDKLKRLSKKNPSKVNIKFFKLFSLNRGL
ncbi:MAG: hypothetical protein HRT89_02825 [Lentisphaeria bacterium]|nr:hypothetical protein [Lentisphaeria bacterium]NQZ66983.1 hypothetical protein [Lentisphaeria bacterium]